MTTLTKPSAGTLGWADDINTNFTTVERALNGAAEIPAMFGDGSDGSATISGTTTLSRDMFYTTLTVQNGGVLETAGFRVYAKTSATIDSGGTVRNNGQPGSGTAAGGSTGTLNGGGNGSSFVGDDTFDSLGGNGGDGGNGGSTANDPAASLGGLRAYMQAVTGLFLNDSSNVAVAGGAGGGGDFTDTGGGGGGVVLVATPTLTNNGAIQAQGGNGGGTNGAGGGGGVILLVYGTKSGSGSTSVAAGSGGSGAGSGTLIEVTV